MASSDVAISLLARGTEAARTQHAVHCRVVVPQEPGGSPSQSVLIGNEGPVLVDGQ